MWIMRKNMSGFGYHSRKAVILRREIEWQKNYGKAMKP